MSDQFGTVRLPALPGQDADPLLTTLLGFLQAAVNADTKEIWSRVNPGKPGGATESLPVAFTFDHDPDETTLSEKQLPALFAWRSQFIRGDRMTADWVSQVSNITLLWIPPRGTSKQRRERQPYRNALAMAVRRALHSGRTPAWVVPGDTDPKAADFGSLFITQAKLSQYRLIDLRPFEFDVESPTPGDKTRVSFDAITATLEVTEISTPVPYAQIAEPEAADYAPLEYVGVRLARDGLTLGDARFQVTLTSVVPPSGPSSGGTAITLAAQQLVDGTTVTVGGAPCTDVVVLDEGVLTARTPPGTAGAADVTITRPDGESATLALGFTFL
jgi:hypothetical protein